MDDKKLRFRKHPFILFRVFLIAFITLTFSQAKSAWALGECGLSCCIGAASDSGVTLASNFGLNLQYEFMSMNRLKHGTDTLTPEQVVAANRAPGQMYMTSSSMTMKKVTLAGAYPISERLQIMGLIPYVINNMDMTGLNMMGATVNSTMDTISGFGDVSFIGNYVVDMDAPVRPTYRLSVGAGLKLPTGSNTSTTSSGRYVHAMMQAGTGSFDPLLSVNYMRAWYPYVLQLSLLAHISTTGNKGYQFGNQLSYDIVNRYMVFDYLNVGLDIDGVISGRSVDHDGNYTSSANNFDNTNNTGLHSIFLTPVLQGKIPNTGGNVFVKYQIPIYQRVNGYQAVVDHRILTSVAWNF